MAPITMGVAKRGFDSLDTSTMIGILAFIIMVGAVVLGAIVTLIVRKIRQRKYKKIAELVLSPNNPATDNTNVQGCHVERETMIQKSPVARASENNRTSIFSASTVGNDSSRPNSGSGGLREEWKRFEANLHSNLSLSLKNHPGLKRKSRSSRASIARLSFSDLLVRTPVRTPPLAELPLQPIHTPPPDQPGFASPLPVEMNHHHHHHQQQQQQQHHREPQPETIERHTRTGSNNSNLCLSPRTAATPQLGDRRCRPDNLKDENLMGKQWI